MVRIFRAGDVHSFPLPSILRSYDTSLEIYTRYVAATYTVVHAPVFNPRQQSFIPELCLYICLGVTREYRSINPINILPQIVKFSLKSLIFVDNLFRQNLTCEIFCVTYIRRPIPILVTEVWLNFRLCENFTSKIFCQRKYPDLWYILWFTCFSCFQIFQTYKLELDLRACLIESTLISFTNPPAVMGETLWVNNSARMGLFRISVTVPNCSNPLASASIDVILLRMTSLMSMYKNSCLVLLLMHLVVSQPEEFIKLRKFGSSTTALISSSVVALSTYMYYIIIKTFYTLVAIGNSLMNKLCTLYTIPPCYVLLTISNIHCDRMRKGTLQPFSAHMQGVKLLL